jgi:hypothetical protein
MNQNVIHALPEVLNRVHETISILVFAPHPLRFKKTEYNRMKADARRWGWLWAIVAVDQNGKVEVLDPAKAKSGREIRLDDESVIDNLLGWIEQAQPG